jgi:eukaryotic-like serine/threonine-protein kinase
VSNASLAQVRGAFASSGYGILEALGQGAMGEVFLAEHQRLRKKVVVKVMAPGLSPSAKDRLRLEAQALARISHENVVQVLDYGIATGGRPFLVMELLEGRTLEAEVHARGALPVLEALDLAKQTLFGLAAVHEAGIVHRDCKPANIFVTSTRRVKLLDFGIIKVVEALTGVDPLAAATKTGLVVGTPKYLSPEQVRGDAIDGRADVYAMGAVLYFLLCGRSPFEEHVSVDAMVLAHLRETPKPPSTHNKKVPPALDAVVLRALAKDPAARHQSAMELAGALYPFEPGYRHFAAAVGLADPAAAPPTVVIAEDWADDSAEQSLSPPPSAPTVRHPDPSTVRVPPSTSHYAAGTVVGEPVMAHDSGGRLDQSLPLPLLPAAESIAVTDPPPTEGTLSPMSSGVRDAWVDPWGRRIFWSFALVAFVLTFGAVLLLG